MAILEAALTEAIFAEDYGSALRLLNQAANRPEKCDRLTYQSPLWFALNKRHYTFASWLLLHGADASTLKRPALHVLVNKYFSLWADGPELLHNLLKRGAALEAPDHWGCNTFVQGSTDTPLLAAVRKGHLYYARWLINAGANINAGGKGGLTPLILACQPQRVELFEVILKAGGDAKAADDKGRTSLHWLCDPSHISEWLYEGRAQVHRILDHLLSAGVDLNAGDAEGFTPLVYLLYRWQQGRGTPCLEFVEQLLAQEASPYEPTRDGTTFFRMFPQPLAPLRVLIERVMGERGKFVADPDTTLTHALLRGDLDVVRMILSDRPGPLINAPGGGKSTPLHIACRKGYLSLVRALVGAGADVWARDEAGATPMDVAGRYCKREMRRSAARGLAHVALHYHRLHQERRCWPLWEQDLSTRFVKMLGDFSTSAVHVVEHIVGFV